MVSMRFRPQRCKSDALGDILDISDKKYPEAAIILSNRDPLDTYMDLLEYENGFDADQIDRLKFYFHNCYIKELSQETD